MKRNASPEFVREAAVKRRKSLDSPKASPTLERPVSPPKTVRRKAAPVNLKSSAVEAGEASIEDHFSFFSSKLHEASRPHIPGTPRISHKDWCDLYQRSLSPRGHHFVIHQHDHPVAGTHYDLRLQCNATSSISLAIMYGLPGDANSRRLNRNASETRVHNLWVGLSIF
jgi:DNA polymerase Ligase (LigD)